MVAHHAPPSLGFSRQEHWSGLSFPSPMHESERWTWSCSVMSDLETPWTAAYQAPPSMARVLEWGAIAFSEWINKYVKKILKCMPECAVHCTKCLTFDQIRLMIDCKEHFQVENSIKFIGEGSLFNHPIINPFYPFQMPPPLCWCHKPALIPV